MISYTYYTWHKHSYTSCTNALSSFDPVYLWRIPRRITKNCHLFIKSFWHRDECCLNGLATYSHLRIRTTCTYTCRHNHVHVHSNVVTHTYVQIGFLRIKMLDKILLFKWVILWVKIYLNLPIVRQNVGNISIAVDAVKIKASVELLVLSKIKQPIAFSMSVKI